MNAVLCMVEDGIRKVEKWEGGADGRREDRGIEGRHPCLWP